MDTIRVDIDRENNVFSVYNNGKGIPIEMHAKEGVYVPEVDSDILMVAHFRTSFDFIQL
jgi:DNA gyrase/topoisomerase IV subunit B